MAADTDDLRLLDNLDEDVITNCLHNRYKKNIFYTYIGDVLVAVNPYKQLDIYDEKHHKQYKNLLIRHEQPPHIYWTADHAYRNLLESRVPHCIVVSGDSGAGKTESTKHLFRHLVKQSRCKIPNLVQRLQKVNPLLEFFGNASTVLNANSSRFGKLVELQYEEDGSLVGAEVQCYTLEKSRVLQHNPGEKNFHVFYSMFAGMPQEDLLYYFLEGDKALYRILYSDEDFTNGRKHAFQSVEEIEEYERKFKEAKETMLDIGINDTQIGDLLKVLAAILLLSNVKFVESEEYDGVEIDQSDELKYIIPACELLQIDEPQDLVTALISNESKMKEEVIRSFKSLEKADDGRGAFVKQLYCFLFDGIAYNINVSLNKSISAKQRNSRQMKISILDISGFENIETNSFEQLLINITNENLHQYFLEQIFELEIEDYRREGIAVDTIVFTDNKDVLDLLLKSPGIIPILEEEVSLPMSTDIKYVQKLQQFCSKSSRFIASESNESRFGIIHYAGEVAYCATGFLDKNTDTLSTLLKDCLRACNNEFVQNHINGTWSGSSSIIGTGGESLSRAAAKSIKSRFNNGNRQGGKLQDFVTTSYKQSLKSLNAKLHEMRPLFVRCVKPNKEQLPDNFQRNLVRDQLKYSGVLEVAKVRKEGYPLRYTFDEFLNKYNELTDSKVSIASNNVKIKQMLEYAKIHDYHIGTKKLFLKYNHGEILDESIQRKRREEEERKRKEEERKQKEAEMKKKAKEEEEKKRREKLLNRMTSSSTPGGPGGVLLPGLVPNPKLSRIAEESSGGDDSARSSVSLDKKDVEVLSLSDSSIEIPDYSDDEKEEDDLKEKKNNEEQSNFKNRKAYDMFRETERDIESDQCERNVLRACRLLMYILLFLGVLGCGVCSKLTLLILITASSQSEDDSSKLVNESLLCICVPYILGFLISSMKILFGKKQLLSKNNLVPIMFLEVAQNVGRVFLLFRVVRYLDIFRGIIVMSFVLAIPVLLNIIEHINNPRGKLVTRCGLLLVSILAAASHLGGIASFYYLRFTESGPLDSVDNIDNWTIGLSLVLISFSFWENYIHSDINIFSIRIRVQDFKRQLNRTRDTTNLFAVPIKLLILIVLTHYLVQNHEFTFNSKHSSLPNWILVKNNTTASSEDATMPFSVITAIENVSSVNATDDIFTTTTEPIISTTFNSSDANSTNTTTEPSAIPDTGDASSDAVKKFFEDNVIVILQVLSTIFCSIFGALACKLHMQQFAFSLSTILVMPVSLAVVYLDCRGEINIVRMLAETRLCLSINIDDLFIPLVFAAVAWVSLIFITYPVWFPRSERMAKIERMFVEPIRDSMVVDTAMLLRRKNDLVQERRHSNATKDSDSASLASLAARKRPHIFVCATMWHETRLEMLQLLKSLFRLDHHCAASRNAEKTFKMADPDRFDAEIHIIFDDAFEIEKKTKQKVLNSWVLQLIECVGQAASSVAKGDIDWQKDPVKSTTPHGGRLTWTMPGGTLMMVHLKDKSKIRHRKRWSQILYLYYLLGFKSFGSKKADDMLDTQKKKRRARPYPCLLNNLRPNQLEDVSNTFIFTLDGDVDFQPEALLLLLDRMTKNKKVGAVCGRIHPIGSGPMVWYQQFEYAVGHWLQKAAEHVYGCVLCCPGCFSLFRASALMDDNVMKTYTTKPVEATHYIQFEQGEDRWLCTLLLQQGYKIDYCAGADALTYAPETFNDFYVQRRRWAPSTMANIMDLLSSWRMTVYVNDNISRLYILYQFIMLGSSLLAPGTIALMIAGSYNAVLRINLWWSFLLSVVPVLMYMYICLKCKNDIQLKVAAFMTSIYTVVMVIVTVGTILNIVNDTFLSPNVLFLVGLGVIFTIAGLWHPREIGCLGAGLLYYVTVPSTFIFLTVYFLCNLNNVSWGTREGPKKVDPEDDAPQKESLQANPPQPKKKPKGLLKKLLKKLGLGSLADELVVFIRQTLNLKEKEKEEKPQSEKVPEKTDSPATTVRKRIQPRVPKVEETVKEVPNYWMNHPCIQGGESEEISAEEHEFWTFLIGKYLYPLNEDKEHQDKIKADLLTLRNNVVYGFFLINFIFGIALLQLQLNQDQLKGFYIAGKYEPLSVLSLSVFAALLTVQFIAMIIHRWSTFQHLLSSTRLRIVGMKADKEDMFRLALKESKKLQRALPEPDYGDFDSDQDTEGASAPSMTNDDFPADYSDDEMDPNLESRVPQHSGNAYDRLFKDHLKTSRTQFNRYYHQRKETFEGPSFNPNEASRRNLYYHTFSRRHHLRNANQLDRYGRRPDAVYNQYV